MLMMRRSRNRAVIRQAQALLRCVRSPDDPVLTLLEDWVLLRRVLFLRMRQLLRRHCCLVRSRETRRGVDGGIRRDEVLEQ